MRVVSVRAALLVLMTAGLAVAGESADKKPLADPRTLIARAEAARDGYQDQLAIELYAQAAREIQQDEGPESVALIQVWAQEGKLRQYLGQVAAANALFEKTLALAARHPDADDTTVAVTLDATAFAAINKGDKAAAAQAFERALARRRAARPQDAVEIARNLLRLAGTYRQQGRFSESRALFEESLASSEGARERDHRLHSSIQSDYALLYYDLGDYDRAEQLHEQALATLQRQSGGIDTPAMSFVILRLGSVYVGQQRYAEAEQAFRRALAIRRTELGEDNPLLGTVYNNLGDSLLLQERYAEAIEPLLRSRELRLPHYARDNYRLGLVAANLGEAYRGSGDLERAATFFEEGVAILSSAESPEFLPEALNGYSRCLAEQGAREAAILHGKRAVNIVQALRANAGGLEIALQRSLVRRREAIYRQLASLLIDAGRLAEAQQVLDLLKEDELYDFLRGTGGDRRSSAPLRYHDGEAEWSARLDELAKQGSTRETYVESLHGAIRALGRTRQAPGERANDGAVVTQAVEPLERGVISVYTLIDAQRVRMLVATPRGLVHRDSPVSAVELARAVFELREAVRRPEGDARPAARRLYALTFASIRDLTRSARLIIFTLDGVLRYAPMAALHDGEKYLIERHALIVRTPAAQQAARAPLRSWSVAALGSTRGDDQLAKLPAVVRELERIVRRDASDPDGVLPGRIFLDEAFTASSLGAASRAATPVVHVASHFVLQPGRALESYLLLGNGARLSLGQFEAQGVRFDGVDLLTLSACDTAAPAEGDGREVEGFGALAQQRGAARVLATLWPVADESTADFMWRVYEFHRRGSTTAEALRRAQLSFLHGRANSNRTLSAPYRHPFYWAPFVLMGDWR